MASPTPLTALLHTAAFAPIENTAWIRVTGEDRVRWLNGMVTNSIQALKPGEGCYNFFLNAQGRIQADCTAWMQPDAILLETAADRVEALMTLLDRFIIMDDVELQSLEHRAGLHLIGPAASGLLAKLGLPVPEPLQSQTERFQGEPLTLLHAHSPLVPRFELWSDAASIGLLAASLQHLETPQATSEDLEHLRLLEGTPLYGTDIRDKELAQETNQTRALHFSKGCYLGQEIVERIRSRGQVHRTLQLFTLSGDPTLGPLTAADKPVGELTSAATVPLPTGPVTLALGYIRREALSEPITYPGGTATPVQSPYKP